MDAHQYEKKINELLEVIDILESRLMLLNDQKGYAVTKLKDYEEKNNDRINFLKIQLENITGKENIDVDNFRDFWGFTSAESIAERLLMPEAKKLNLSDERITEIIKKICLCDYSEAETDTGLRFLKRKRVFVSAIIYIFPTQKDLNLLQQKKK